MVDFKKKLTDYREKKGIKSSKPLLYYSKEPKFSGWTYEDYLSAFRKDQSLRFLEPMSAQEPEDYEQGVLDIAELKMDGHRGLLYLLEGGNRAFSRRVSKKTGWYNENSDQVPHIRDLDLPDDYGTILDGEFDMGGDSMDVQSVMGSLPERAIKFQEEKGFVPFKVFDILYYRGVNVQAMPLWKRKIFAALVCFNINENLGFNYITFVPMYVSSSAWKSLYPLWYDYITYNNYPTDVLTYLMESVKEVESYTDLFRDLVSEGIEGLIVKNLMGQYEQKRSKNYIKMKGIKTFDVVVMGYTQATVPYEGKLIEESKMHKWPYWYHPESDSFIEMGTKDADIDWTLAHCDPVTKPHFNGWIGAIRAGVFKIANPLELKMYYGSDIEKAKDRGHWYYDKRNECYRALVAVMDLKGLPDSILEDIKENGQKYIDEMRTLEVTTNGMIDASIGSVRHPRFSRWRDDKSPLDCTWEAHVKDYPEPEEREDLEYGHFINENGEKEYGFHKKGKK